MSFLTRKLKHAVSGKRSRYKKDGYDLDLTYVTQRIIAMGLPSDGVEALYRNNGSSVARFLNSKHDRTYMIFNLSERSYNYDKFHNMVQELGFADHHNPPLLLLFTLTNSISNWLKSDKNNVAVVHCLAGKGRTGLVISCYLMMCGLFTDPDKALTYFRSQRLEGVNSPSQVRYAHYFSKVLKMRKAPFPKPFMLKKIYMHYCGNAMAQHISGQRLLVEIFELTMDGPNNCRKRLRWSCCRHDNTPDRISPMDIVSFTPNVLLRGDALIACRSGSTTYFRIAFHTGFLPLSMLRLKKEEMDESKRLQKNFLVDLIMSTTDDSDSEGDNAQSLIDITDPELEGDMQRLQTLLDTSPRSDEDIGNEISAMDVINTVHEDATFGSTGRTEDDVNDNSVITDQNEEEVEEEGEKDMDSMVYSYYHPEQEQSGRSEHETEESIANVQ